ncbi:MAG: DNA replication/repair protein RecF [Rickettsiales bacterium]
MIQTPNVIGQDHDSELLEAVPSSPTVLSFRSLSLHCFRNYISSRIEVTPAPVVLTGRNGAGKTNILEAISLFTPGRGLRKAKLGTLDNIHQNTSWAVAATVYGMSGIRQIGTGRDPQFEAGQSDKRIVKIDGKVMRSQSELSRHMSVVWLTPQMEQLFQDGASAGRKFLDRLAQSFDADHASRINKYEHAMRERNRLLQHGGQDKIWLDALEQTMAEMGAAIAEVRLQTVSSINHAASLSKLSFPKAQMSISGFIEDRLQAGQPAIEIEDEFREILAQNRGQDMAAGRALIGAHRSELKVIHVEKQMPAESCSTGEQKAVLLSIILAQAKAAALWKGIVPIVLLDEVIAHLDGTRKLELFEEICQIGAQIWMTGVDADLFADLQGKASFLKVENGTILNDKN